MFDVALNAGEDAPPAPEAPVPGGGDFESQAKYRGRRSSPAMKLKRAGKKKNKKKRHVYQELERTHEYREVSYWGGQQSINVPLSAFWVDYCKALSRGDKTFLSSHVYLAGAK